MGKTYAMLQAAREETAKGRRVVLGYVECHGRHETECLLADLPLIPRRQVPYRGVTLEEMDLDAVLAASPELAIVDELAHTNAPGSRHARRYQDVEELLDAGIDVFTTLNVQHIESVNDIVAQITGVTVRETVPDHILEAADETGLVDLPPDELIQRLREGKVYVPDQASRAVQKFFRPGNLTALRELALRYLASRVDHDMRNYMDVHAIPGPWPAGERVLVCIDADPLGERLVRTGRRMATGLDAEWIVLHVETREDQTLSEKDRDRIARVLRLAEELGGRTVTLPGSNAAEEIIRYARAQNVTKILVGVSHHPRWVHLVHGSLVDRVIRASGAIDVYVISAPTGPRETARARWESRREDQRRTPLTPYVYSLVVVALATAASATVKNVLHPANLTMLYLLGVVVVAFQWGRGPASLAAALSVVAFGLFFVPTAFVLANTQYLLTFAALLAVGLVISNLASRAREQAQASRRREMSTAELYGLSAELAATSGTNAIVQAIARHVEATFTRGVALFLPEGEELQPKFSTPGFPLDVNENAVATWVFRHGQPAGHGTDTLPAARARYLPLKTARRVVGVLAVQPPSDSEGPLNSDQRRLLDAFASQAAIALERAELSEEARRGQVLRETERLQTALLNSISHDLRTPLASITGALSSLVDGAAAMNEPTRRELLENAKEEADRLNHLLGNLLDMNRLESGALKLRIEPGDVEDLVGTALAQLGEAAQRRDIRVSVPASLPHVPVDFALVTQALVNVLDNAVKYSPSGAPIEVRAQMAGPELQIRVEDRGPGIPTEDLKRVFDKFYRIQRREGPRGVGLGLAISKGIIEAHGGRIWAENRPEGGTAVVFTLPLVSPSVVQTDNGSGTWVPTGRAS